MTEFRILDTTQPTDWSIWLKTWESWPDKEVFGHPAYIHLFDNPNHISLCAYYKDAHGEALFPFHLRDLTTEPWCPDNRQAKDFISPYGYGGPFVSGSPSADQFWEAFTIWGKKTGIVSGFFRRGLFGEQLLSLPVEEVTASQNIVRTLDLTAEAMWADFEHKVRKNVNKARRSGLVCSIDSIGSGLKDFLRIYRSTMQRRSAADFFYFEPRFFESLLRDLPDLCKFFHVSDAQGQVVSSELVLVSDRHLYSFLGGTLPEALPLGTNDLLKFGIIEWGRENGFESFVLGGGFRPDDGIYRYKRAFANNGVVSFNVGRWILDPVLYATLVDHRRKWERTLGLDWEPAEAFFPAFRAPGRPLEPLQQA